jgi:hypothetical protein
VPTLPKFVYPGLAGTGSGLTPPGTLVVGGVPKPTGPLAIPKPAKPATNPSPGTPTPYAPSPASSSSPTAPSPAPAYDPNAYNLDTDPIVAQIKAANLQSVSGAEAAALEGKRNLLTQFGSQEIARRILGANDPTLAGISDNPDTSLSTLGQLARSYREQGRTADENLNQQNLFYSGARVRSLRDLGYGQQKDTANATSALNDKLAGLDQAVLQAQDEARQREIQGRSDALSRAVQFAMQYGVDPGANGSEQPAATGSPASGVIDTGNMLIYPDGTIRVKGQPGLNPALA